VSSCEGGRATRGGRASAPAAGALDVSAGLAPKSEPPVVAPAPNKGLGASAGLGAAAAAPPPKRFVAGGAAAGVDDAGAAGAAGAPKLNVVFLAWPPSPACAGSASRLAPKSPPPVVAPAPPKRDGAGPGVPAGVVVLPAAAGAGPPKRPPAGAAGGLAGVEKRLPAAGAAGAVDEAGAPNEKLGAVDAAGLGAAAAAAPPNEKPVGAALVAGAPVAGWPKRPPPAAGGGADAGAAPNRPAGADAPGALVEVEAAHNEHPVSCARAAGRGRDEAEGSAPGGAPNEKPPAGAAKLKAVGGWTGSATGPRVAGQATHTWC